MSMKLTKHYLGIVFLIIFVMSAISPSARSADNDIMRRLTAGSKGKTPVVKNFPDSFPEVLTVRGDPLVYTRKNSKNFEYIGMPVGGIGAAQLLYLGGDGKLWWWDLRGAGHVRGVPGENAYRNPIERSADHPYYEIGQGFSIRARWDEKVVTKTLDRGGIAQIEFRGQYPIGEVTYRDPKLPVVVTLQAFSPFIPGDLENSIFPAVIMAFTVKNTSSAPVEADLAGWLENAVLKMSSGKKSDKKIPAGHQLVNRIVDLPEKGQRLQCTAVNKDDKPLGSRTLSLDLLGSKDATHRRARPKIDPASVFEQLDRNKEADQETRAAADSEQPFVGGVSGRVSLAPGEKKELSFLLTWHVNNKRYYAEKFSDAFAVSDHIAEHFDRLSRVTRLWRNTWYDSTLPYWFLDRTFLPVSVLATPTCYLDRGGRFYANEGYYHGWKGTCTHVWGYVQAMGRLFPQLEVSLREKTDFVPASEGGAMNEHGIIGYRSKAGKGDRGLAVDGQSGVILRSYLTHQMSPDDAFLKRNYASIKKAMQGLTEARDADHDGILTGPQPNTMDAAYRGVSTWLSLYYQAALRAMAEMADEMSDADYAVFCRRAADKGKKYLEENVYYKGEYFYQKCDPDTKAHGSYTGCEYSRLVGQNWAYQVGLGQIIDPEKATSTLESLWRYNFSTDVGPFREKYKGGRWYAMPGEGGLIACTWPYGGSEALKKGKRRFASYKNECQNGYEYAATSVMMWHGMPYRALAHTWYLHHDRYHGSKRNPWNEIEWGMHYARSMAGYGLFTGICGFEYHGPKRYMAFSPRITPEHFKAPFVAAEGWGTFEQQRRSQVQSDVIRVAYGKLRLNKLAFDLPKGSDVKAISLRLDGDEIAGMFQQKGRRVHVGLPEEIILQAEQKLGIEIEY